MRIQQNLLRWFKKNQRPLPWRKHYRPYDVWVSEMMLQQTQMETVLPYYRRWMKELPTLHDLAKAPPEKVLKLWEGLGYYSRARNIHTSAKRIQDEFGGVFPSDYETIRSLKGIGPYSAGAIASIAFNQKRPIVDGNILRVLSRLYAISDPIDVEKNRRRFWELQDKLIPSENPRDFNQGLMELGALVCTSRDPACPICPLSKDCKAYRAGEPERYPVKTKKKKMIRVHATAVVLCKNKKFLLRYRPIGEIMGGLWEFPEWKLPPKKALSLAQREWAADLSGGKHLGIIKRNYTNHLETLDVIIVEVSDVPSAGQWKSAWASKKEFAKYPFSSAHAKIARLLTAPAKAK